MTEFTPIASLIGGVLIGLSAILLLALNGRIAGISGITNSLLPPAPTSDWTWRAALVAGVVAAPVIYAVVSGEAVQQTVSSNLVLMAVAGLLVGFGSTLGGGCTSGHGVCGLSRLSVRSLVATGTFMTVAFVTVFVARHVIGG